jgi:hypothetical protein
LIDLECICNWFCTISTYNIHCVDMWVIGTKRESQFERKEWIVFIHPKFMLVMDWLIASSSAIAFAPLESILLPVAQVSDWNKREMMRNESQFKRRWWVCSYCINACWWWIDWSWVHLWLILHHQSQFCLCSASKWLKQQWWYSYSLNPSLLWIHQF